MSTGLDNLKLIEARLDWAKTIIDRFDREARAFLSTKPHQVRSSRTPDGDTVREEFYFQVTTPVPSHLAFLAADAIHNLRSVVDNLVWAAGTSRGAHDFISLGFRKTERDFATYCQQMRADLMPQPLVDWMLAQQHFEGSRKTPSRLWCLNEVWNRNKHRVPVVVVAGSATVGIRDTLCESFTFHKGRSLVDGDLLATSIYRSSDAVYYSQTPSISVALAFNYPADLAAISATDFLWQSYKELRTDAIPLFRQHLQ